MKQEVYDLVDRLNATTVQQLAQEKLLREHLRAMDDHQRTEFCFYLEDTLSAMLPAGTCTSLERVEKYVASQIKITDWTVNYDDLMAELHEINAMLDDELFDILDED